KVVKHYKAGQINNIKDMLNIRKLSGLYGRSQTVVEQIIMNTKGIQPEDRVKYYTSKMEEKDKSNENLKRTIDYWMQKSAE
ncbi:MAG: hypothetical protein LBR67_11350, partial [Dysgonamonadaceae bacterium]|nr:hypothetical protein [Dysgonamonadaceae bacterium]